MKEFEPTLIIPSLPFSNGEFLELCTRRTKLLQKFDIKCTASEFNIFQMVSSEFVETAHSQILKKILDPHTPTIGDSAHLERFLKLIGITFDKFPSDVQIESEKGRIDVLVYWKEAASLKRQCVIIENKINDAPDMTNQLCRYYEYAQDRRNMVVRKVVYLPRTYKLPSKLDTHPSKHFKDVYVDYDKKVRELLVIMPVFNYGEDHHTKEAAVKHAEQTFAEYLDEREKSAIKQSELFSDHETALFFKHYSWYVKRLGGNTMTASIDEKLVEQMFLNEETIKIANTVAQLMLSKNITSQVGKIIGRKLSAEEDVHNIGVFKLWEKKYYKCVLSGTENEKNEISLGFWPDNFLTFGVTLGPKTPNLDKLVESFKLLLDTFAHNNILIPVTGHCGEYSDKDTERYGYKLIWRNLKIVPNNSTAAVPYTPTEMLLKVLLARFSEIKRLHDDLCK